MGWTAYDSNGEKHEFSNISERNSWMEHNEGSRTAAQKVGDNILSALRVGYNGSTHSSSVGNPTYENNEDLEGKTTTLGGNTYQLQGTKQDSYVTLGDGTQLSVDYGTGGFTGDSYAKYIDSITGQSKRDAEARARREAEEAERKRLEEERKAQEAAAQRKQDALKLEREAREAALSSKEASAKNAYTAARNTGLNRQASSAVGAYSSPNSGFASNYSNLQSAKASTAADFLNKMGYVNGLNQQASNLQSGAKWNTIGAALSGAGEGAQVGAALTSNSSR